MSVLTPRADAAMQSRFLKALRRKGGIYARHVERHPESSLMTHMLDLIAETAHLAWDYGATLDDVAEAVGLVDPRAVLGLDDTEATLAHRRDRGQVAS